VSKRETITKLPQAFYARPTLEVAPDLLGKYLIYKAATGRIAARIVEVEGYLPVDDPACHAARGLTRRNRPMFGPPGRSYIYFIYGMYHCLNFVTEQDGTPGAVLLRAAEVVAGRELLVFPRGGKRTDRYPLSGPGKLCRAFGLSMDQNDLDLTGDRLYLEDRHENDVTIKQSPRIGIKVGVDHPWRFYDANSSAVTRPR